MNVRPTICMLFSLVLCLSGIQSAYSFVDVERITIPEEYGKVRTIHAGASDKTVFVISDMHDSSDVQKGCMRLVDLLASYYSIPVVGIEGASGVVASASLKEYPHRAVKETVLSWYMRKGYMSGACTAALMNDTIETLLGVEDKPLYEKQISTIKSLSSSQNQAKEQIGFLEGILAQFSKVLYTDDLRDMVTSVHSFTDDAISLLDHAKTIVSIAEKQSVPLTAFSQLTIAQEIKRKEEKIVYDALPRENEKIQQELKKVMGENVDDLLVLNSAAESADTDYGYYRTIALLCMRYAVSLTPYPMVERSVQVASLQQKIDTIQLLKETKEVIRILEKRMITEAHNERLERLVSLQESLAILRRFIEGVATDDDVDALIKNPDRFISAYFIDFIRAHALACNVSYRIHPQIVVLDKVVRTFQPFYEIAHMRSTAFVSALLAHMDATKTEQAILVVGSFHIPDIEKELGAKGVSFISLNPYVERVKSDISFVSSYDTVRPWMSWATSVHVRPWLFMNQAGGVSEAFIGLLLSEYGVQHLQTYLSERGISVTPRLFTKAVLRMREDLAGFPLYQTSMPRAYVNLKRTSHVFFETVLSQGGEHILYVQPLADRMKTYAHDGELIPELGKQFIEEGIYTIHDRMVSELTEKYGLERITFADDLKEEIEKEMTIEKETALSVSAETAGNRPLVPTQGTLIPHEHDVEARDKRLKEMEDICASVASIQTLEGLTDAKNRFLIIKSQLSFYSLSHEMTMRIAEVEKMIEQSIRAKIDEVTRQQEMQKKEAQQALEKIQYEQRKVEEKRQEEVRKVIDTRIAEIMKLKPSIENVQTLADLQGIENDYMQALSGVHAQDLNSNDRVVLNSFKIALESKQAQLQRELRQNRVEEGSLNADMAIAILKKALSLKELAVLASLPQDIDFIQSELKSMMSESLYEKLDTEERTVIESIAQFIDERRSQMESGVLQPGGGVSMGAAVTPSVPVSQDASAPSGVSLDRRLTEVYQLRNKTLSARTIEEMKILQEQFDVIDREVRAVSLSRSQKELLSSTESLLKATMQRIEKLSDKKRAKDAAVEQRILEREKAAILQDLLGTAPGEKSVVKSIGYIESNPFERTVIQKKMEKEGFRVYVYETYQDALKHMKGDGIEGLLLDDDIIEGMTGIDFVIKIKAHKEEGLYTTIPVVVHTNHSVSQVNGLMRKAGIASQENVSVVGKNDIRRTTALLHSAIDRYRELTR